MRLADLPEPYRARVSSAQAAVSWAARCRNDAHSAQWAAWNVCHDAWYDDALLRNICDTIDDVDRTTPGLDGPELLAECAQKLKFARRMSAGECGSLPAQAVTHVRAKLFGRKFELAPESAWAEGSAPGELDPTLLPGDRVRVMLKGKATFHWLTFNSGASTAEKAPDDVARALGLAWAPPTSGSVVRIEVPLDPIHRAGARLAIPIVLDAIYEAAVNFDWRARPEAEHRPDEPWGYARDMRDDGPGLPEVVADITAAGKMDAEILGELTIDWSTRPYLQAGGPR